MSLLFLSLSLHRVNLAARTTIEGIHFEYNTNRMSVCFLSVAWPPAPVVYGHSAKSKYAESSRRYREKLKAMGPEHYRQYQQQARERMKRLRDKKKQRPSSSGRTYTFLVSGTAPGGSRYQDQQQTSERAAEQSQVSGRPSSPTPARISDS